MENLRTRLEELTTAVAREDLALALDDRHQSKVDRLYDTYGELAAGDELGRARAELERVTGTTSRDAWRRIIAALEGVVLAAGTRAPAERLRLSEARETARLGSDEHVLSGWAIRLRTEESRDRRRHIEDALDRLHERINPLREELHRRRSEVLGGFGAATGPDADAAQTPVPDGDRWHAIATRLLEDTEPLYNELLRGQLEGIGVDPGKGRWSDGAYLDAMPQYRQLLPAEDRGAALDLILEGMEMRLRGSRTVRFDDGPRPHKSPRPHTFALTVPGEVVIALSARIGVPAYEALFECAGQALFWSTVSPDLPYERRRIVDHGLVQLFGLVIAGRLADPAWVEQGPLAVRADAYLRDARYRRLAAVRRVAARVRFEHELHALPPGAEPGVLAERYGEELSAATGLRHSPLAYLEGDGREPRAVDRLRALCFEAQLSESLRESCGRRYWRTRAAAATLRELMNAGGTYTLDELAAEIGLAPLRPDRLLVELLA